MFEDAQQYIFVVNIMYSNKFMIIKHYILYNIKSKRLGMHITSAQTSKVKSKWQNQNGISLPHTGALAEQPLKLFTCLELTTQKVTKM